MSRRKKNLTEHDDAFIRTVTGIAEWILRHRQIVVAVLVIGVLATAVILFYQNVRAGLAERAAAEMSELRAMAEQGVPPDQLITELSSFLDEYSGTPSESQARVLLGRIHLRVGQPGEAVRVLEPMAGRNLDTPAGFAANRLLAGAYEDVGELDRAEELLAALAEEARFGFQRRAAAGDRARILVERGQLREAEGIYARLVEEATEAEEEELYSVRLGEVRARLGAEASDGGRE